MPCMSTQVPQPCTHVDGAGIALHWIPNLHLSRLRQDMDRQNGVPFYACDGNVSHGIVRACIGVAHMGALLRKCPEGVQDEPRSRAVKHVYCRRAHPGLPK